MENIQQPTFNAQRPSDCRAIRAAMGWKIAKGKMQMRNGELGVRNRDRQCRNKHSVPYGGQGVSRLDKVKKFYFKGKKVSCVECQVSGRTSGEPRRFGGVQSSRFNKEFCDREGNRG